ncbi:hypothetical protein AVEN_26331-1 [Araneus ventricosus]|uniref:Uncharacterized protein n=1 Tax=Araneus ventricosus TaxID=182803 RepID=A0A4Y2AM71_ARAVE|nr:hypothetical protein AVEN_26331-1 [Araneus ventricosus]
MEFPCKLHNGPLHPPRDTVRTPPPAFKMESPPLSRESFTPLLPFRSFRFSEKVSLPFPHYRTPILRPTAPNRNQHRMKIQTVRPDRAICHWSLASMAGFGANRSK